MLKLTHFLILIIGLNSIFRKISSIINLKSENHDLYVPVFPCIRKPSNHKPQFIIKKLSYESLDKSQDISKETDNENKKNKSLSTPTKIESYLT